MVYARGAVGCLYVKCYGPLMWFAIICDQIYSVLLHLSPSGMIDHPQASQLDLEKSDVALGGPESLLELKDSRPHLFSANPRCRARLQVKSEVPSANV